MLSESDFSFQLQSSPVNQLFFTPIKNIKLKECMIWLKIMGYNGEDSKFKSLVRKPVLIFIIEYVLY